MTKITDLRVIKKGRYSIRAGVVSDKARALIFLGHRRVPDVEFSSRDLEETIAAALEWVNQKSILLHRLRRAAHIASQEEYEQYFHLNRVADHEREMLRFHAMRKDATMGEIAGAVGWDYSAANLHYGWLGMQIAGELGLTLKSRPDGTKIGISSIGDDGERGENDHYVLSMHPELLGALRGLGIAE